MSFKSGLLIFVSVTFLLGGCSKFKIPGSQLFDRPAKPVPLKALAAVTPTIKISNDWQVSTGSNMRENKVHPHIDKQTVYVAGGYSASAWQQANGKILWKTAIGETVSAGVNGTLLSNPQTGVPAKTTAEQVFIGTTSGNAIAMDAKTGNIQWIERLSSEVQSVSPAHNNRVVFRTIDGILHGLSSVTGELIWQRSQTTPSLSMLGASVPVIVSTIVIEGFDNGKVAAYNLQTGKEIWQVTLALPRGNTELDRVIDIDGKLKPLGNALFAASLNGSASGINMETGKLAWSRPFSTSVGVNADPQGLYSSDDKGNVWRIDPNNGTPIWSMDDLQRRQPTVPALVGTANIVVADKQGNIHWINVQTGKFVARSKADSAGYSVEPEVSGNSIYAIGKSGVLSKITLQ